MQNLVRWVDANASKCVLEEINLENNNLRDDVIIDLVEALLKTVTPLRIVNFSHNRLTNKGATAISELINVHYNLQIIKIGWNKI